MMAGESQEKPYTIVSFIIRSKDLNPDDVTDVLGLVPHDTHVRGDHPGNNSEYRAFKDGMWSLDSKLSGEESLSAHVQSVLDILNPKQAEILRLSEQHEIRFFCSIHSLPGLELSPQLLKQIAALGAGFGASVYPSDDVNQDIDLSVV